MISFCAALRLSGFVLFTLPLMPLQKVLLWTSPRGARWLPHWYHRSLCRLLGFRVVIEGTPPAHGPALVVSNHVSWIDIVVLSAAMPCAFIAKQDVAGWPFFGSLARLQRTVFIDRTRRHSTGAERNSIKDRLQDGDILVLFPEGTSHNGAGLLPFRSSYFGAADDPAIPVIPVTLAYVGHQGMPMTRRQRPHFAWYGDMDLAPHLWGALRNGPIKVKAIFHPAFRAEDVKSRKGMAAQAERLIRHSLAEALHGTAKTG